MNESERKQKLAASKFRSRFKLTDKDRAYIADKGWPAIEEHARDFIRTRLAPAQPKNDGKQTPFRGHPVFIAQHATATCCRGCLQMWYGIGKGHDLPAAEFETVIRAIMEWIKNKAV